RNWTRARRSGCPCRNCPEPNNASASHGGLRRMMDQRTSDTTTVDDGSRAAPQPRGPILSLRNIRKSYRSASGEVAEVLKDLNLEIQPGSFNVIRGESGSGKTSLLRIIGMLDGDFEGDYLFVGDDIKSKPVWYRDELRSNNIGFIFQDGQLFTHM